MIIVLYDLYENLMFSADFIDSFVSNNTLTTILLTKKILGFIHDRENIKMIHALILNQRKRSLKRVIQIKINQLSFFD